MSREIKFRYWHTELQKMIETIYRGSERFIQEPYMNFEGKVSIRKYTVVQGYSERTIIPSQYTGLKDDNSVEIFEGDIVQYLCNELPIDEKGEICSDWIKKKRVIVYRGQSFNVPQGFVRDIEVIGNIYENPELLDGDDK